MLTRILFAALAALLSFELAAGDAATPASETTARGVLKRIDATRGVLTIAHEPIPALKWPAMTMDFKLRDAKLAASLKAEQKVEFTFTRADGGYFISRIAAAP